MTRAQRWIGDRHMTLQRLQTYRFGRKPGISFVLFLCGLAPAPKKFVTGGYPMLPLVPWLKVFARVMYTHNASESHDIVSSCICVHVFCAFLFGFSAIRKILHSKRQAIVHLAAVASFCLLRFYVGLLEHAREALKTHWRIRLPLVFFAHPPTAFRSVPSVGATLTILLFWYLKCTCVRTHAWLRGKQQKQGQYRVDKLDAVCGIKAEPPYCLMASKKQMHCVQSIVRCSGYDGF